MNIDQTLRIKLSGLYVNSMKPILLYCLLGLALSFSVAAQTAADRLPELRWKSESQVKLLLGEPTSVQGPIGTHASYVLWKYENMTVAFSNGRVFHVFDSNSLQKVALGENR